MFKKIEKSPKASAIFYGAVSSIIASAILSGAPFLWDWLTASTLGVLIDFVNGCYIRAATLEAVNYSFFVLTAMFVVFVVLCFEILGRIKKKIFEKEAETEKKDLPLWMKKGVYIFFQTITIPSILYGLIQISGEVIVLNTITDFKQHMLIVTPYIEREDKDMLLSQWSQIRTMEDYNKVYERLIDVANKNDLKLYKNRMY
ncbi:hypothetical protein [Shewanella sp. 1180_01]|uniref:hypothetical protein n=1 Tax=Shewanella sp. 1180_01 TaxID=2604451 RepID=UPI004062B8EF